MQTAGFLNVSGIFYAVVDWLPGLLVSLLLADHGRAYGVEDSLHRVSENAAGIPAATMIRSGAQVWTGQILPQKIEGIAVEEQLHDCITQLEQLLNGSGSSLSQAARLHVCASSEEHLLAMMERIPGHFPKGRCPAISYVVSRLPDGALAGLDVVASRASTAELAVSRRSEVAILPEGQKIFIAGQAEPSQGLEEATAKTLDSLSRTLKFLGRTDQDIVQLKAFVQPMSEADVVRQAVGKFYGEADVPPLVLVEWNSSAEVPVEIELVAWGGPLESGRAVLEFVTPPEMTHSPVYSRVCRTQHPVTIFVGSLHGEQSVSDVDSGVDSGSSAEAEVASLFGKLENILQDCGSDLRHMTKATYYVSSEPVSQSLNVQRRKWYDPERPPAASKAMVTSAGSSKLGMTLDMIAIPEVPQ
jgi:enamine deaminase RidA (YjgF/YER057c/UK114 family)